MSLTALCYHMRIVNHSSLPELLFPAGSVQHPMLTYILLYHYTTDDQCQYRKYKMLKSPLCHLYVSWHNLKRVNSSNNLQCHISNLLNNAFNTEKEGIQTKATFNMQPNYHHNKFISSIWG